MEAVSTRGTYGVDAPWVPWMWVGYAALYAALAFIGIRLEWWSWSVAVLGLMAALSLAGAALFWYASRRGKFVIWNRLLASIDLPRDAAVLDLGCGRGMVAIMTAVRFRSVSVVGIDLWRSIDQSGNSEASARANAVLNDVEHRIRFDTGDMVRLPYADDSFDLVTASLSIHNIRDRSGRRAALTEAVRVLAPGGSIVIADIRRASEYAEDLRALGFDVTVRSAGWRGWWSGPWMSTTIVRAMSRTEGEGG